MRKKFPKLFLILVPRHFERCKDLGQKLRARGVKFMFRSEIFPNTQVEPGELDCLLVNTTGELKFFYEPATAVFVGKQAPGPLQIREFLAVADNIPQLAWMADPTGAMVWFNRRWYEFTGTPLGSTDGEGWNGMFHPEDQERAWATWRAG